MVGGAAGQPSLDDVAARATVEQILAAARKAREAGQVEAADLLFAAAAARAVDGWDVLDVVLAAAAAALAAGDEDKALRLFDAAEELEVAIKTTHNTDTIEEQNV